MKIVVFEQDNCGWCVRLHPHISKLAEDSNIDLEFINITDKWELADEYQFRSTPTVVIINEDVVLRKFSIQAGKGIPELISGIKEFISK
jgi:thiol-disulfide isomerase/thioredoxin